MPTPAHPTPLTLRPEHDIRSQFHRKIVRHSTRCASSSAMHPCTLTSTSTRPLSSTVIQVNAPVLHAKTRNIPLGLPASTGHGLTGTHRLVGSEVGRVNLDADDVHRHVCSSQPFGRGHRGETLEPSGASHVSPTVPSGQVVVASGQVKATSTVSPGTLDLLTGSRLTGSGPSMAPMSWGNIPRLSALVLGNADGRSRVDGRTQGITCTDHVRHPSAPHSRRRARAADPRPIGCLWLRRRTRFHPHSPSPMMLCPA